MNMIDTENRDRPICPWCGHENSSELLHPTVTRMVLGCAACHKDMDVVRNTTITFTTKKLFNAPVIGIASATVTEQPERALLTQMVQLGLIAKGSTTLEVIEEMITAKDKALRAELIEQWKPLPEDDEPTRKWKAGMAEAIQKRRDDPEAVHSMNIPLWFTPEEAPKLPWRGTKAELEEFQVYRLPPAGFDPSDPNLVSSMAKRMEIMEHGYLKFEDGHEMTDEQLATLNEALGIHIGSKKGKDYRPYCLRCSDGPRVALTDTGFQCWSCGNAFGFDLVRHDVAPG